MFGKNVKNAEGENPWILTYGKGTEMDITFKPKIQTYQPVKTKLTFKLKSFLWKEFSEYDDFSTKIFD